MQPRRGAGAIEEFDHVRFGGPTQTKESGVTVQTTVDRVLAANPDRVMLILTNNGPNVIRWGTVGTITTTRSQQIANGQTMVFQVQNDGALCGVALYAFADVAASELNILELIRQRPG